MIYGSICVQGAKGLHLCLMESKLGVWMQLFALELKSLLGRVRTRIESNVRKSLVPLGDRHWAMPAL